MEPGRHRGTECDGVAFLSFRSAKALGGFNPILDGEEFALLNEIQELFDVFRQNLATISHNLVWIRELKRLARHCKVRVI